MRESNYQHRTASPSRKDRRLTERENERLRRDNDRLRQELTDSQKKLAESEKQIADLERQLGLRQQNSTTSSKPPSSDGLAGKQRERCRRKKSGRKPGGQPGHRGHWRPQVPPELVDDVVKVYPAKCSHCACNLSAPETLETAGAPRRHQVTELPKIKAHITEYQCENVLCPGCGKATQAPLPEEVRGHFGPDLTALMAYLTVVCRMPRRVMVELLEQVLSIPLSLGTAQNSWEEASAAADQPCRELESRLPHEPVLNCDETGYRTSGEKRWLWALVASNFVFYRVAASRGAEVLVQLLGIVFAGILCSDRCPSYEKYHKGTAQYCWAHFKRNILGAQDLARTTATEKFCRDALALHARLFRLWHRFRAGPDVPYGPVTREQLILKSIPIQRAFFALGRRYLDSPDKDARNLGTALFVHCEKFFTFIEKEGVEPTNNSAERALRCAVQWRKTSFGSRSPEGEVAMARLLTVARTCRMQNRNSLYYLALAIRAHRSAQPAPSLLHSGTTT